MILIIVKFLSISFVSVYKSKECPRGPKGITKLPRSLHTSQYQFFISVFCFLAETKGSDIHHKLNFPDSNLHLMVRKSPFTLASSNSWFLPVQSWLTNFNRKICSYATQFAKMVPFNFSEHVIKLFDRNTYFSLHFS